MSRLFDAMRINGKLDDDNGCPWFDADCKTCPYDEEYKNNRKCDVTAWNEVNDFILSVMEAGK